MDTRHNIKGSIQLEPIAYPGATPEVLVKLNDDLLFAGTLEEITSIDFDQILEVGSHRLSVEFYNKKDSDTQVGAGLDKAVIVKKIDFFGVKSPRFVWAGNYQPVYPSHMRDEPAILKYHNYLGWNGVWYLDFTTPIFTWIHHVENLGWIYD